MVATSVVEVKAGRVALYPGDYESYVARVEQEIAADEAVTQEQPRRGSKKKEPVEAARGKELRAQKAKLRAAVRAAEKRLDRFSRERDQLNAYFLEQPTDFSEEKARRSEVLKKLVADAEEKWLALQVDLEELDG